MRVLVMASLATAWFCLASPLMGCGSDQGSGGSHSGGTGGKDGGGETGGMTGGIGGGAGSDAAAGGSSGAAGADGGVDCSKYAGITKDQACSDFADAFCGFVYQCAPIASTFDSEATCKTRTTLSCVTSLALPGTGSQAGDVAWLTDFIKTKTCDEFYAGTWLDDTGAQPCGTPGTLADGQPCVLRGQCVSGYCPVAPGAACGVCAKKVANGGNCSSSAACESGQCDFTSGTCQARQPVGGTCQFASDCEDGLYCAVPGQCAQTEPAGGPCTNYDDETCVKGLVCDASNTCEKPALAAEGADCSNYVKWSCDSFHSLTCDPATKKCVSNPPAMAGEACGFAAPTKSCEPGLSCIQDVCVADVPDGSACDVTAGPLCISPARCVNGSCTLVDGSTCPADAG